MTLSVAIRHGFPGFDLDVSFEAPAGVTVLFGPSGSGKTTLINAMAGLLRPRMGRIAVDDWVLLDTQAHHILPPHRRRLGYIFQEGRLFPHLTVRQNLHYGRWFAPRDARHENPARVIEMLGIGHLLDRRPGALSGGEKQRVAIGRALLAAPKLILADEPLAALDEARKAEILPYVERLRDEVAVPRSPFMTANMPDRILRMISSEMPMSGASATGTSLPSIDRTRRGTTARPVAMRAVITASCNGEVST